MEQKLISICIPTYNRPEELKRTLESIDTTKYDDVNIVISENCSAKQAETREVVKNYMANSKYEVHYFENEKNIGYDKNIRALISRATGRFCMFFSDDDIFMPNAMDDYVEFIRAHKECGFILRSYRFISSDGSEQDCRYYSSDKEFPAGRDTSIELFDKGVFISGVTIRRECAANYVTEELDGSLLYQIYLVAEVCREYPAAYSRILISQALPGIHYFGEGNKEAEYTSGLTSLQDRLNFYTWYMKIIDFLDGKYQDNTGKIMKKHMSKYSFSIVATGRRNYWDFKTYCAYCQQLYKIGFGSSIYFYLYCCGFFILGNKGMWGLGRFVKKVIGHRPQL